MRARPARRHAAPSPRVSRRRTRRCRRMPRSGADGAVGTMPSVLLLFDIDGTLLLKATAEHVAAVHEALREVYGISDPRGAKVEAAGRTDIEIARDIALLSDVSAERFDASRDDFHAACVAAYARLCPDDLSEYVAPGVPGVLEALSARDGVRLGLLTGNLEQVARLKLARAGRGLLRAGRRRLRLRQRRPHRPARDRPRPRGRLPARADGDHRRYAARHRLCARRRSALHRRRHRPLHRGTARGRGRRPRQRPRAPRRPLVVAPVSCGSHAASTLPV